MIDTVEKRETTEVVSLVVLLALACGTSVDVCSLLSNEAHVIELLGTVAGGAVVLVGSVESLDVLSLHGLGVDLLDDLELVVSFRSEGTGESLLSDKAGDVHNILLGYGRDGYRKYQLIQMILIIM